jgi:hypothetical protein
MRFFPLLLLCCTIKAAAQEAPKKFEWNPRPALHTITGPDAQEAAVFLDDDKTIEYSIEKEGLFIYKTVHRLIHINSDQGVEAFNRVYLPFDDGSRVVAVKARTILPNNRIINFDEQNIKEIQEDNRSFKIFALDGLTTGCEVEYFYTIRKVPSFFGRESFSYRIPVLSSRFELISPKTLRFDARTYNELPQATDTVIGEKRYLSLNLKSVKAQREEPYSMDDANAKRIEYKLSYNLARNSEERLFTWDELAQKVYANYNRVTDKEQRKVRDFIEGAGITAAQPVLERITRLESFLKKSLNVREDISDDDAEDVTEVIKTRNSSERAINKIFGIALGQLGIEYELVLTGDRSDYVIDKKLENWNNARHLLLYFPSVRKYLAPAEVGYRIPWIPPTWGATQGLFIVSTKVGNLQSAYGEFRNVTLEDKKFSFSNMDIKAELDANMDSLVIDSRQQYGGYTGMNYRAPFVFAPADQHYDFVKRFVSFGTKSEHIRKYELQNQELDQKDPYAPFTITARVHSSELVEKAGNKIIIKVGELIGDQAQLYDEKERQTNIDLSYAHNLQRKIEIKIPQGYVIKNLKDLEMNEAFQEENNVRFNFASRYELDKDILRIYIDENYNNHFYPRTVFGAFRKVINASADFNKVVLVLEKQK